MTDKRRKVILQAKTDLRNIRRTFEGVLKEEQTSYENIPYNLLESKQAINIEYNVDTLEEITGLLEDAISFINDIK